MSRAFAELDSPPYTELLLAPGITLNTLMAVRVIGALASRSCEMPVCVELLLTSTTSALATTLTASETPPTFMMRSTSSAEPTLTLMLSSLAGRKLLPSTADTA